MTSKAIPVEDLSEEEIALISAAEVDPTVGGEDMAIHRGSGCLWTDMGYENPAEMTVKTALALQVCVILEERGWRPAAAAEATGLDVRVFVDAQRNRAGIGETVEALARLGCDILITVGEAVEGQRGAVLVQGPDDG